MDRRTRLLENLARRQDNGNGHRKMAAFMRLHPPTFDSAEDNPLLADSWLRTITKKLNAVRATDEAKVTLATHQLIEPAKEWWENYQEVVNDPAEIPWQEFVEAFREHHIPEEIMEIKQDEFHALRQGPTTMNQYIQKFMKLARYAPDDVNIDRKKQKCFIKGLNGILREQIIGHIYPDFNTLMNKSILIEEERNKTERERKHKFLIQRACQPERTQQARSNNSTPTRYPTTMQYRSFGSSNQ
jgi:hypothetical protein